MESVDEPLFATAISSKPSPLKSDMTLPVGFLPTAKETSPPRDDFSDDARIFFLAFQYTINVFSGLSTTRRSVHPSLSKSAARTLPGLGGHPNTISSLNVPSP